VSGKGLLTANRGEEDMPTIKPQVLAAISGAIAAYIADEEACQAAAGMAAPAPGPPLNLWALAGRQEAMQLRLLMQRRSLR
jgi:hypothetical protein